MYNPARTSLGTALRSLHATNCFQEKYDILIQSKQALEFLKEKEASLLESKNKRHRSYKSLTGNEYEAKTEKNGLIAVLCNVHREAESQSVLELPPQEPSTFCKSSGRIKGFLSTEDQLKSYLMTKCQEASIIKEKARASFDQEKQNLGKFIKSPLINNLISDKRKYEHIYTTEARHVYLQRLENAYKAKLRVTRNFNEFGGKDLLEKPANTSTGSRIQQQHVRISKANKQAKMLMNIKGERSVTPA